MNRVADDLLLQELERQEDYIQTAADAIDAKAGLILAAGAFLAVQPAVLLVAPNISKWLFVMQLISFVVLSVAVSFAHRTLKIEGYYPPGFDEAWRDTVIAKRGKDATEEDVKRTVLWGLVEQTKGRIAHGRKLNESKLSLLSKARFLTTASFAVNIAILTAVLISRFF